MSKACCFSRAENFFVCKTTGAAGRGKYNLVTGAGETRVKALFPHIDGLGIGCRCPMPQLFRLHVMSSARTAQRLPKLRQPLLFILIVTPEITVLDTIDTFDGIAHGQSRPEILLNLEKLLGVRRV